ncbi:GRAM-domain-containing protein [Dendrothele bispora CBS 962.96]|uniref:GRAM-domain-containing protein n=1 Tax=Dendrothele bispora (strain CBS 962.96) TaxID=1314807 RepID=A0A4V4HGZ9_DENBC|nr:GRAM-domain-containing protein [Dendrothele bispora CBS 962.96]
MSIGSDHGSINGSASGHQNVVDGYYSGLDDDSDEDSDEDDDDDGVESLDLAMDDIPVTGFAVASSRRNADFHELFPSIPAGDYLIEDYGCALQREILIQGRLYISENHICFHANILGWITDLSIPIYEIQSLEKKMTAFVIPNAIMITTRQAKYTFASFLSRDTTYDVIYNIWRLARPGDNASLPDSNSSAHGVQSVDQIVEGTVVESGDGASVVPGPPKKTVCACSKEPGGHYPEIAMDIVIPGTPEKLHNLIFASGFMKDFMGTNQKLMDIQISDWAPVSPGSKLLARNMSYIKPLNGAVGPKQTKCEIRDETVYCDFQEYVATVTTTKTPDVPSGGVFSVKTRTCIMWASPVSSRIIVTSQVEWTGRSFIKGIIERSAIDGQKTYHADLEKAMRAYITEHQTEFVPEGVKIDPATIVAPEAVSPTTEIGGDKLTAAEHSKNRERERNARGLQWAYDTFEGATKVAKDSISGLWDLVKDAWDQSSTTTILYFLIAGLVVSNIYTYSRMGSANTTAVENRRRTVNGNVGRRFDDREDREKLIRSIVTTLWDELAAGKGPQAITSGSGPSQQTFTFSPESWPDDVAKILQTLDEVEERVKVIRVGLRELQPEQLASGGLNDEL